jgi:hypothetical protein
MCGDVLFLPIELILAAWWWKYLGAPINPSLRGA